MLRPTGGYSFTAPLNSISNIADFSATSGITVDMTNGQILRAAGPVQDALAGAFLSTGSNTVIGSSTGSNTFYGNVVGTLFTAQNLNKSNTVSYLHTSAPAVTFDLSADTISGGSADDSYSFPASAKLMAQGSPGADTFIVGTTLASIEGGGGADTLNVGNVPGSSSGPTGVTADLNGSIKTPGNVTVAHSPGCALPTDLCVTNLIGSTLNDTIIANAEASVWTPSPSGQPGRKWWHRHIGPREASPTTVATCLHADRRYQPSPFITLQRRQRLR